MKICIHRGTHQIGGVATEISTEKTRILIDMGDELSLDADFVSAPLRIPGVTDTNGRCGAVLFTHYHCDHTGQMTRIRPDIPLYCGALAKEIMLLSAKHRYQIDTVLCSRIKTIRTFRGGETFMFFCCVPPLISTVFLHVPERSPMGNTVCAMSTSFNL